MIKQQGNRLAGRFSKASRMAGDVQAESLIPGSLWLDLTNRWAILVLSLGYFSAAFVMESVASDVDNPIAFAVSGEVVVGDEDVSQGQAVLDDELPESASLKRNERLRDLLTITLGENKQEQRTGDVLLEAVDGSLLFEDELGHLLLLKKTDVVKREEKVRVPQITAEQLEQRLKAELPAGFRILKGRHYTYCYWTDQDYAQWVSVLYERLYTGFNNYWDNRGFETEEAERPLVVLIFANRQQYDRFARLDMKAEPTGIIGYYHVLHNWVVMYDLTADGQFGNRDRDLSQVLSHPNALPMVATIVHEATHQLMFNNGMQQRLADIPLWVSEGLAVYFEAPDLRSKKGWKGIGQINILRYGRAKSYLRQRPVNSLTTLIQDDKRFRDPGGTLDAYAEAWALNFFLLKRFRKQYQDYLQALSAKSPLDIAKPEERIQLFEEKLGKSVAEIDNLFLKFLIDLR